jgi:predicted permease
MGILGDWRPVVRRTVARLRRSRLEAELADEIRAHIELRTRALIDDGMDPREAAYEARRMFGNATAIREETRDMWGYRWLDTLRQDTRFGARLLRRSPVFTVAAVASLAIGIGSAAAVFGLADTLLFRTLPVRDAQQLALFRWTAGPDLSFMDSLNGYGEQSEAGSSSTSFSYVTFRAMQDQLASRLDVFGFADIYRANATIDGQPDAVFGQVVSGNYFHALGMAPAAGRLLGPADDRPDASPAAVISHALWQRRFGGAFDAIGKTIAINGLPFAIVGVLPRGFAGTMQISDQYDVTLPMAWYGPVTRNENAESPNYWWVLMMARLKPGHTLESVRGPADVVLKQMVAAAKPEIAADKLPRLEVEPGARGQSEIRNQTREPFQIIAGVVAIVLLVACANVANLLLARGRAREREIAVRAAIGAHRLRIVRQLLTEGLLLGALASVSALILAHWIAKAILPALAAFEIPLHGGAVTMRVVGFTTVLAFFCTLLFGLGPAIRGAASGTVSRVHDGGRGAVGVRRRFSASGALVVAQVALSMLLLTAAALLTWSAYKAQNVQPGFDPTHLLTFSVDTSLSGYEPSRARNFFADALSRLRALPGVTGASIASHRLIANSSSIGIGRAEGVVAPPIDTPEGRQFIREHRTWRIVVDDRFHETLGITRLRGRGLSPTLDPDGPKVAIINLALAKQLFGTEDAVGRRFIMSLAPDAKPVEVIGIVADARYTSLRTNPPPTAYFPYQQEPPRQVTFHVRTAGDPAALANTVRESIRQLDETLPLFAMRTQEEQIRRSLRQELLFARLAVLLGGVTLVLSGVGLYGLLAYAVTRRTPEIGVRMALGARRGQVGWMILRQSLVLVAIGLAVGIPAAYLSSHLIESLLFGLEPRDPRAIAIAAAVMVVVALTAAFVPARRASRVDPLVALRAE